MKPTRNRALTALAVAGFLVLSTAVKVAFNAQDELEQGRAALAAGQGPRAVEHFERALRWHLPGLGTADEAAEALWHLAEHYEKEGQRQPALDACRLLRASFYATRHLLTPGREWIERCNGKIADLMAGQPPQSEADRQRSPEERRRMYRALLERERPPHTAWALTAETGFLGWVACLVGLIVQGFTRQGEVRPRFLMRWTGAFVLFYIIWLAGMARV